MTIRADDEPSRTERAQIRASWGTIASASVAVLSLVVAVTSLVFSLRAQGKPIAVENPPGAPFQVVQAAPPVPNNVRPCPDRELLGKYKEDAPNLTVEWRRSDIDPGRMTATVSFWRDAVARESRGVAMRGPMGLRDAEDTALGDLPTIPDEGACGSVFRVSREMYSQTDAQYVVFENLYAGEIYCFGMFPNVEVSDWSQWMECSVPRWDSKWGAPDVRPK